MCIRYYNLYETQYTYDVYNFSATYCGDFHVARERERENFYRKINFNLKLCYISHILSVFVCFGSVRAFYVWNIFIFEPNQIVLFYPLAFEKILRDLSLIRFRGCIRDVEHQRTIFCGCNRLKFRYFFPDLRMGDTS